jgi:dGTPase
MTSVIHPFGLSGERPSGSYCWVKRDVVGSSLSRKTRLWIFEGNANGCHLCVDKPGSQVVETFLCNLRSICKIPKESLPVKPCGTFLKKIWDLPVRRGSLWGTFAQEMGLNNPEGSTDPYGVIHLPIWLRGCRWYLPCHRFWGYLSIGNIAEDHALEQLINLVRHSIRTEPIPFYPPRQNG